MTPYQFFYGENSLNHQLFMLINHAATPFFDKLMPLITMMGDARMVLSYLVLLVLLSLANKSLMPRKYPAVFVLGCIASLVLELGLKGLFHVPRPAAAIGIEQIRVLGELKLYNSLPSGHSIFAFMAAFVLSYGRNLYWKIVLFFIAACIAYSRIYVGAHYPLDVMVGALVGVASGFMVWKFYEYAKPLFGSLNGQKGEKAFTKEDQPESTQN